MKDGIAEVSVAHRVFEVKVADLLLDRRIPLQAARGHQHREEEVQLRVLLHVRLDEHGTLLRIDPRREPIDHHVRGLRRDLFHVLVVGGEGVPVGDHVEVLAAIL